MVRAQALVVAKADGHRLVAAVHRDQIDVQVDDEVALHRPPVHPDRLPVAGAAEFHDSVRIFGIVVVVARREKFLVDRGAHHPPHFRLGHLPVEAVGDDEMHVVHAVIAEHFEDHFERDLPDIRSGHRRKREADVVERDGDPHSRPELGVERVAAERVVDGVADRAARVGQPPGSEVAGR